MYRLALALGRTLSEIETTMTSSELSGWQEYYAIEPFGQWRDNYHSAQLCALLYNVNRGKGQPVAAADYMYMDAATAEEKQDMEFIASMRAAAKR